LLPRPLCAALLGGWLLSIGWILRSQGRGFDGVYLRELIDLLGHLPFIIAGGLAWNLILLALMWFLFTGVGLRLLKAFGLSATTRLEHLLLAAGLGAGTTSLALLTAGLCGLWQVSLLRAVFVAGLTACLVLSWFRLGADPPRPANERYDWWSRTAVVLLALAIVTSIISTGAPDIFFDSLVYHLALPQFYLLHGRIMPTPENMYSGIPFGMEMLYGLALALSDERLAVLLHCSFGIATAAAVWVWLRQRAGQAAGILGALIFFTSPVVMYSGWQGGVDLAASFYLMLGFVAFSSGLETLEPGRQRAWAVAAGLYLGFALGVKYTVAPMGVAFVLVQLWLEARRGMPTRHAAWLAATAAVAFSPWLLKNLLFYGNPVYPFANRLFGPYAPANWELFLKDARSRDLFLALSSPSGWWDLFIQPWAVSVPVREISDWLGPVFLMLTPGALVLRWRKNPELPTAELAVALLAAAGYCAWLATSTLPRFLVPILPLIVCVTVLAVERGLFPSWLRRAWWVAALMASLYNFQIVIKSGGLALGKWDVLRDRVSRTVYLENEHISYGAPYYAAMVFINKLPRNAKVLFLGESRSYYCERDRIASTAFDHNPFWTAVRAAQSAGDIHARVKALGITHVFVNAGQLSVHSAFPAVMPRDLIVTAKFGEFWARYLRKVFEKRETTTKGDISGSLIVYELRDAPTDDAKSFPGNPFWDVLRALLSARRSPLIVFVGEGPVHILERLGDETQGNAVGDARAVSIVPAVLRAHG